MLPGCGKEQPYLNWFYANKAVQLDSVAPGIPGYVGAYTPPGCTPASNTTGRPSPDP